MNSKEELLNSTGIKREPTKGWAAPVSMGNSNYYCQICYELPKGQKISSITINRDHLSKQKQLTYHFIFNTIDRESMQCFLDAIKPIQHGVDELNDDEYYSVIIQSEQFLPLVSALRGAFLSDALVLDMKNAFEINNASETMSPKKLIATPHRPSALGDEDTTIINSKVDVDIKGLVTNSLFITAPNVRISNITAKDINICAFENQNG